MIKHLSQDDINLIPTADWYAYTLECTHIVYTKIRINCAHSYNEHFIRCMKCQIKNANPTNWQPITDMRAVSNEEAAKVTDGYAFVMGERILRTDGTAKNGAIIPAGNPLPYKVAS